MGELSKSWSSLGSPEEKTKRAHWNGSQARDGNCLTSTIM